MSIETNAFIAGGFIQHDELTHRVRVFRNEERSFHKSGYSIFPTSYCVDQRSQNLMEVINEEREDQLSLSERYELKKSVRGLLESSGEENWDGENALPILPESVKIAENVIDLFPSSNFLPEVSATPHGEIDFDWVISKDIMLTISVCPTGKIAYSGIFNIQGSEEWSKQLPPGVVCWLAGLQKMSTEIDE